jgi:hypothetical protein
MRGSSFAAFALLLLLVAVAIIFMMSGGPEHQRALPHPEPQASKP